MARFLIPKIQENMKNDDSKWHQTSDRSLNRFFIDLGSVLGANLKSCWPPFSLQNGPGGLQDAPRRFQDGPRRFQKRPG